MKSGEILVLENVRTFPTETKDGTPEEHAKTDFVKNLAPLADLFVNDAFAAAHRAHVQWSASQPFCQALQDALWKEN